MFNFLGASEPVSFQVVERLSLNTLQVTEAIQAPLSGQERSRMSQHKLPQLVPVSYADHL